MVPFRDLDPRKKLLLCLLLIASFCVLLFLNSVALRENKLHATYSQGTLRVCEGCKARHESKTASTLVFVNNWWQEGAGNLRFALFKAPRSVEFSRLDQRSLYPTYPPGAMLPVYLLFRTIDGLGLVDNFAEARSKQLLALIAYNYFLHFLLATLLCFSIFLVLRQLGFDLFNAAVLACIPAVIQLHNAASIYWHHVLYTFDSAVLLPYLAFVVFEQLRLSETSRAVNTTVRVLQPLLLFYGVLTDWLFLFVAVTVFVLRLIHKDIAQPRSAGTTLRFITGSCAFFAPALLAVGMWVWQVSSFSAQNLFVVLTGSDGHTPHHGLGHYHYLLRSLYTWLQEGYGLTGVLLLYATFYTVLRARSLTTARVKFDRIVVTTYVALFVPCLLHTLFFPHHAWDHPFSVLKFSLALSASFIVLPLLVLQLRGKPHRFVVAKLAGKFDIYAVTALSLAGMTLYVYLQIFDRHLVTHFFRPPDFAYVVLGDYVRNNTSYDDVLFSNSAPMPVHPPQALSMSGKVVHPSENLDQVYLQVRGIEQDFRVRFFHLPYQEREMEQLRRFLEQHDLRTTISRRERVAGFLSIDGQTFLRWYEQTVPVQERPTDTPT